MICPRCGASVTTEANFCMKCGAALSNTEQAPRKVMRLEVPIDEHDAQNVTYQSQQPRVSPASSAQRRKLLLAGVASFAGVVFIFFVVSGIWLLLRFGSDRTQNTNTRQTNANVSALSTINYDKEELREMTLALASRLDGLRAASDAVSQNANSVPVDRAGLEEGESLSPTDSEVRTMRVRFAPGSNSTTIGGLVERGQLDRYLFSARAGQQVVLRLSTTGDARLLVHLLDGEGVTLSDETRSWSGTLPETGEYAVDVFTSDDEASYQLLIVVQ